MEDPPLNGTCGVRHGEDFYDSLPAGSRCNSVAGGGSGQPATSPVTTSGGWTWNCPGSDGGSTASCSANLKVDGVCGSSTNSCSAGSYSSAPTDSSTQYLWTCGGINNGSSASCSASKPVVNGVCGTNTYTCSSGSYSWVSYPAQSNGYYASWKCKGSGGGPTASCSKYDPSQR